LFTYFITLSLLAALTLPVAIGLELFGVSVVEFVLTPAGDAIYSAFNQIANLLSIPIWIVSFTLLYFDNRVRKEGYDMELLAREVAPGFYWQAAPQPAGYPAYPAFASYPPPRVFMQTGPLGLGGYVPQIPQTGPPAPETPPPNEISPDSIAGVQDHPAEAPAPSPGLCANCGQELPASAQFCIRCGTQT
jgi:hypothetical protein